MATIKILVIGDLHGHMPKFHFKEFDAIIAPGDFCSSDKIWKIFKKTYIKFLENPDDYEEWYNTIPKSDAKKLVKKSLSDGRKILKKLNSLGVPVYIIPGNWDYFEKDKGWEYLNKNYYKDYLIKGLKNIKDCHEKNINIGGYSIIGYGLVNGPELLKHRDYKNISKERYKINILDYKKKIGRYNKLFKKSSNIPKILLSHNVPFNTELDKIVNKDSPRNGYNYGSNIARDLILRHKPILCISGHMHEHYGTCKLGKTVVLNAGFGGDKNTLIELRDGNIKSIKFYGKKC
jgi:Icc-related predicted phosphoesterase